MIVTGVEETNRNLDTIIKEYRKNANKALQAGAEVMLQAATAAAPERSGVTKANLKIRKGKTGDDFVSKTVGVGKKDFSGQSFYAAFVLFGHFVGNRKLGAKRKWVPENNWLERAFDSAGQRAADAIIQKWQSLNDDSTPRIN